MPQEKTAAVLLIGDELLSGRTRDINLQTISRYLGAMGIQVREARIISDDERAIVEAVNALRASVDYVFTTGGLGPTHDDITAEAVARAFNVNIGERDDALAILTRHYERTGTEFTPARRRMARIPDGASLILNPVSSAPGFQIENVFVMAGIPSIVQGMLEDVGHRLEGGAIIQSQSLRVPGAKEGEIAVPLAEIARSFERLSIGSYPWFNSPEDTGVSIVARGQSTSEIEMALSQVAALITELGLEGEVVPAS